MPPLSGLPAASWFLAGGFTLLMFATLGVACLVVRRYGSDAGSRRLAPGFALLAGWIVVSGAVAASGLVARWDLRPPPGLLLFGTGFVLTLALSRHAALREVARRAPVALLIGFQAFRLPLEWFMHRAYSEGLMPIQMSYSGRNFDIVTGILAVALVLMAR